MGTPALDAQTLGKILNALNDGVVVMDRRRTITYLNPAAERMTGWQLGEPVPYCRFCQEREVAEGEERCFLAAQQAIDELESEMPTRWGTMVPVTMTRSFLVDVEPKAGHMVITIRDATVQRQAEALRRRVELHRRTLEVLEEERRRLSLEIHDGVLQLLYSVRLGLDDLAYDVQGVPEKEQKVRHLIGLLEEGVGELRALSQALYPPALDDLGLTSALRQLAAQWTGRTVEIEVVGAFPPAVEAALQGRQATHVYRIVQEAIHNAVFHGRARTVLVRVGCGTCTCRVLIVDDGRGFDVRRAAEASGLGLRSMAERAASMGGRLWIKSRPGRCTRLWFCFPRPEPPEAADRCDRLCPPKAPWSEAAWASRARGDAKGGRR
ncbi:MAG: PAS domain-containing protein [Hydrogenibacillus schlegelii]|nr:PAS domain-containing protein [Hydrogenibacillus schlegelii]